MMSNCHAECPNQSPQQEIDPSTVYVRKFSYIPFRTDGKNIFFSFFYENKKGERISQQQFLIERLKGRAILVKQDKNDPSLLSNRARKVIKCLFRGQKA